MQLLFTIASVTVFAVSVISLTITPKIRPRADPSFEVTLNQVSKTLIKAIVKNAANRELVLLKLNLFNDQAPLKKVSIYRDGIFLHILSAHSLGRNLQSL